MSIISVRVSPACATEIPPSTSATSDSLNLASIPFKNSSIDAGMVVVALIDGGGCQLVHVCDVQKPIRNNKAVDPSCAALAVPTITAV
jgi:hypothetical protein